MIDDNDPSVYLVGEPSKEGRILTEQAGQHNGSWVPFWMFAELAVRAYSAWTWISSADALAKRLRRYIIAGVTFAGANLGLFAHHWIERHDAAIVEAQRAADDAAAAKVYRDGVRLEFDQLHHELDEIRRALLHVGVRVPGPSSDVWRLPDVLSLNDKKGPSCSLVHVIR